jgi:hypothetical protein
MTCDGPIGGSLTLSYPGIQLSKSDTEIQQDKDNQVIVTHTVEINGTKADYKELESDLDETYVAAKNSYASQQVLPLPRNAKTILALGNMNGVLDIYSAKENNVVARYTSNNTSFPGDEVSDTDDSDSILLQADISKFTKNAGEYYGVFSPAEAKKYSIVFLLPVPTDWKVEKQADEDFSRMLISVTYKDWSGLGLGDTSGMSLSLHSTLKLFHAQKQAGTLQGKQLIWQKELEFPLAGGAGDKASGGQ